MENKTNKTKKNIFDLKNLSKEDKQKYISYGFFGLVFCGIMGYGISNYIGNDENETVTDFTNPQAEQSKYNSKLDALNPKDIPQSSNDLEYTFKNDDSNKNIEKEGTVNFEQLDKQLAQIGNSNDSKVNSSYSSNITPNSNSTNSHNVYGNYDMWTSKEPSNSKIGYNSKKNVPNSVVQTQTQQVKQPNYDVIEQDVPNNNYDPVQRDNKIQNKNTKQIQASLLSKGFASNGRSLSFVLLEPFTYKGETVKKGQILVGTALVDDERIFVKFSSGKFNGKNLQLLGFVTGIDGGEGLPISKVESSKGSGENVKNEVLNQSSRIPVVGGVVRSVQNLTRKSSNYSNSNKVYLTENTKCIINIYE